MIEVTDTFKCFKQVKNYVYTGEKDLADFGILRDNGTNYIFQDRENKELGYKIYKSFCIKKINNQRDAHLIQRLREKGEKIIDIDFPYGVVTYNNSIIGQVISYYDQSYELIDYFKSEKSIYSLLLDAYNLIKELYDAEIYYMDIHEHNFLITLTGIKLIDFDYDFIGFKSNISSLNNYYERNVISNFKRMVCSLLYENKLDNLSKVDTMESLYEELLHVEYESKKIKVK